MPLYPKEERYALCDQMRRSAVSVTSNLAEGMGRESIKEQIHFIEISYGSLLELYSQLQVSVDLGYITNENYESKRIIIVEVAKMLSKLRAIRREKLSCEQ